MNDSFVRNAFFSLVAPLPTTYCLLHIASCLALPAAYCLLLVPSAQCPMSFSLSLSLSLLSLFLPCCPSYICLLIPFLLLSSPLSFFRMSFAISMSFARLLFSVFWLCSEGTGLHCGRGRDYLYVVCSLRFCYFLEPLVLRSILLVFHPSHSRTPVCLSACLPAWQLHHTLIVPN